MSHNYYPIPEDEGEASEVSVHAQGPQSPWSMPSGELLCCPHGMLRASIYEVCVLGALLCLCVCSTWTRLGFVILAVSDFMLSLVRKCEVPVHLVLSVWK